MVASCRGNLSFRRTARKATPIRLGDQAPGVGAVNTAALDVEVFWDILRKHASFASEPANRRPYYINQQAPKEYKDDARYTTPPASI